MPIGHLKKWNSERGFGFIAQEHGPDIFVHISALKGHIRPPVEGDFIQFDIERLNDGKHRAVNCQIQGVAKRTPSAPRARGRKSSGRSFFSTLKAVIAISLIGFFLVGQAYNSWLQVETIISEEQIARAAAAKKQRERQNSDLYTPSSFSATDSFEASYSCQGKTHCSEMSSCAEATFYLRNCPGVKIDGDGDGIPCESQHCGY